uniref:Nucleotidyltransferase domain-containing protein n=1 Tax=Alexandrium catenella TaxID=2925 RepID=A0A7S1RGU4_ALECA
MPSEAVRAWVDRVRRVDFAAFALRCGAGAAAPAGRARSLESLGLEWSERLKTAWPMGADLAFMAQTGSFMYDLQVPSSDCDYSIIFLADPEDLASRTPPATEFHRGKELGPFLLELAKGNPRNVELLFTEKPHITSPVWQELRSRRHGFVTLRCARQYFGFIMDRLGCASKELEAHSRDGEVLKVGTAKRFSKWLYHAHHKLFGLLRLLETGEPLVALAGQQRDFVLGLRLRPPELRTEAMALLEKAEAQLRQCEGRIQAAEASGALPAEVDAEALLAWLGGVRASQAARAPPQPSLDEHCGNDAGREGTPHSDEG